MSSEANYKSLTQANLDWYESNIDNINRLLRAGEPFEVIPVINTLGEIWEFRDGAVGAEIATMIAQSFIYHTHLTFLWFEKHPKAFDGWIDELPEALLTDYDGSESTRLKALKTELLASLNYYLSSSITNRTDALANRFLIKLKTTEIRVVD
jgi:hypothetical protein